MAEEDNPDLDRLRRLLTAAPEKKPSRLKGLWPSSDLGSPSTVEPPKERRRTPKGDEGATFLHLRSAANFLHLNQIHERQTLSISTRFAHGYLPGFSFGGIQWLVAFAILYIRCAS